MTSGPEDAVDFIRRVATARRTILRPAGRSRKKPNTSVRRPGVRRTAPAIKISSNSATYRRMIDDMDLNAGQILEGVSMEQVASQLLELTIAVASGQPSKSEALGVGEAEFCPWHLGGMI